MCGGVSQAAGVRHRPCTAVFVKSLPFTSSSKSLHELGVGNQEQAKSCRTQFKTYKNNTWTRKDRQCLLYVQQHSTLARHEASYMTLQIPSLFSLMPGFKPAFFCAFLNLYSSTFLRSLAKSSSYFCRSTSRSLLLLSATSLSNDFWLSRCSIFWYSLSVLFVSRLSSRTDLKVCEECFGQ